MFELTEDNTFQEWSEFYLRKKKGDVGSTYYNALLGHNKHACEYLGAYALCNIEPYHIDELLMNLSECNPYTGRPTSRTYLKYILNFIENIFELAIDYRAYNYNPAKHRKIPNRAVAPKKRRALTEQEINMILANPNLSGYVPSVIMMFAGLRRGELIPLRWCDINFDRHTISIQRSVFAYRNRYVVKDGAKTEAGKRIVDIPLFLSDVLKKEQFKRSGELVISKKDGTMHTESSFRRMWNSYLIDLNCYQYNHIHNTDISKFDPKGIPLILDRITPHMMRHTYATLLYLAGIDMLSASKLLGHSDPSTTAQIYVHIQESVTRRDVTKLQSYVDSHFSM